MLTEMEHKRAARQQVIDNANARREARREARRAAAIREEAVCDAEEAEREAEARREAARSIPDDRPATRAEIRAALPDAHDIFVEAWLKSECTMPEVLKEWTASRRRMRETNKRIMEKIVAEGGLRFGKQIGPRPREDKKMSPSTQRVLTDEERFREDWDNEPTMQAHFGGQYKTYVHYRRALRDGRVNIVEHSPGVFHGKPVPSIG